MNDRFLAMVDKHRGFTDRDLLIGIICRLDELGEHVSDVQSTIDDLTSRVTAVDTALAEGIANITAEIAALKGDNPTVDTSKLEAAVSQLETDAAGLSADETPTDPTVPPVTDPTAPTADSSSTTF